MQTIARPGLSETTVTHGVYHVKTQNSTAIQKTLERYNFTDVNAAAKPIDLKAAS